MRFRLGLLQDTAAIEKQIARDAAEAKKPPTVKTEAQTKADEARAKDPDKGKETKKKPKIRPLSEAKAIDLGANFVSETFLLAVGIALILFENARKGRQEANRREDVADQIEELQRMNKLQRKSLVELDKELMILRGKTGTKPGSNHSLLPQQLRQIEESDEEDDEKRAKGWVPWVQGLFQRKNPEVESPKPATIIAPEVTKEANGTESASAPSTSILTKILPRSKQPETESSSAKHSAEPSPSTPRSTANRTPKDAHIKVAKDQ